MVSALNQLAITVSATASSPFSRTSAMRARSLSPGNAELFEMTRRSTRSGACSASRIEIMPNEVSVAGLTREAGKRGLGAEQLRLQQPPQAVIGKLLAHEIGR